MPNPVGRPPKNRQLLGQQAPRRDQDDSPTISLWQTDVISNREPGFSYQFFRNDEVADKLRPTRLVLQDFETGQSGVYNIPGWQICHRETGPEEAAGWRPDEGKPIDTVLRHGSHVAMKIPTEFWEVLQRAQEQRADAYEQRLQGGHQEQYNLDGNQASFARGQKPAVKLTEQPLQRI